MKKTTKGFIWGSLITVAIYERSAILETVKKAYNYASRKIKEAKKTAELEAAEELEELAEAARNDASK